MPLQFLPWPSSEGPARLKYRGRKVPTPPSLKYNANLCGGRPPAGPPPSTAGQHSPDRLLQPKMGWLNLSPRRYASGNSKA